MTLLKLLKVTGSSLEPRYREGDFVLVSKIPFYFRQLRPGDVIVFERPPYGMMIKFVEWVASPGNEIYVTGIGARSVDSRQFGPLQRHTVLGKVIWHIRQKDNPALK